MHNWQRQPSKVVVSLRCSVLLKAHHPAGLSCPWTGKVEGRIRHNEIRLELRGDSHWRMCQHWISEIAEIPRIARGSFARHFTGWIESCLHRNTFIYISAVAFNNADCTNMPPPPIRIVDRLGDKVLQYFWQGADHYKHVGKIFQRVYLPVLQTWKDNIWYARHDIFAVPCSIIRYW